MENKQLDFSKALGQVPHEQLATLPYFQNRGKYFLERCFIEDGTGIAERAFSDTIKAEVENTSQSNFFRSICNTEEEMTVALTVFQWLTTNIGESTLAEAKRASKAVGGR